MRKLIYVFFLLFGMVIYGQETVRKDFNYVTFYQNGKWGTPQRALTTVIFDVYNRNIIIYKASGKKEIYRQITSAEESDFLKTAKVLDERGNEAVLSLDHRGSLVMLSYSEDQMVMFSQ